MERPIVHVLITGYWRPRETPIAPILSDKWKVDYQPPEGLQRRDPLVLDLDGAGIQTVGLDALRYFDQDGNAFQELSGWVSPGSGLLMVDWNGNHVLDSGTELFSDSAILPNGLRAANGFDALAHYDSNHDGKIDGLDPIWSQLKLWQYDDTSGLYLFESEDGGKISSVDEVGLSAIYLDSEAKNSTDTQGNTEVRSGSFEWKDGRTGTIAEYNFARDTSDTIASEFLDVPEDIESLPQLAGYGNVHTLHQAMVRDASGELKALVEAFASEGVPENRAAILDQMIFKWTGADSVQPDAYGTLIDARKIVALDRLHGTEPRRVDASLATLADQTYQQDFETFYSVLMSQTHLKDLFDSINYFFCERVQERRGDTSAVVNELRNRLAANREQGTVDLAEFARTVRGLQIEEKLNYLSFRETFIQQDPFLGWVIDTGGLPVVERLGPGTSHLLGTNGSEAVRANLFAGDNFINGLSGDDVIYGSAMDEWLINETGDALIVAGGGNDTITAGDDDDILDGGPGNDRLYGEGGNDTYIFRRGSGHDRIIDIDATAGNVDTIWLGSSLTPEDITLKAVGTDLVLKINDTGDTLAATSFFDETRPMFRIERIQFMDGTVWNETDIHWAIYRPSEGADYIKGTAGDDEISTLGGNDALFGDEGGDTLHGEAGDDTLAGGAGDDRLVGGPGQDLLDGGAGDDILDGTSGKDTYVFGRGSGHDNIDELPTTDGTCNTVVLGAGVLPTDMVLERTGYGLTITIADTGDSLTITAWGTPYSPRELVDTISFADGTIWGLSEISSMLGLHGTDGDDVIYGFSTPDAIQGFGGSDQLYGLGGEDTLDGGPGIDA
ncbi:MAG: calcium-binding protein, partial [Thermodesulfobacteriota bacterium]